MGVVPSLSNKNPLLVVCLMNNQNLSFEVVYYNIMLNTMDKYICEVCDWVYDPAVGDPDGGIAPGTMFENLPDDWVCPLCGVGKDQFKKVD